MHPARDPASLVVDEAVFAPVGAVIVTSVDPALAIRCVRSLAPAFSRDRIVVVVNPPGTGSTSELAELDRDARLVRHAEPVGYGASLNEGADLLPDEVELLLLLNDDIVVDLDALRALWAALAEMPRAAMAGPNLVGQAGDRQDTVFSFPSIRSEAIQALILPQRLHRALRRRFAQAATLTEPRFVDWVLGAAMLVRRDAFREVGGFDEGYVLYSEETDLCFRLRSRGWRTLSCGLASFLHDGAASTATPKGRASEAVRRFASMAGVSRRRYIRLHWGRTRRVLFACTMVGVYAWNLGYVALRVAMSPSTRRAKLDFLRARWTGRLVFCRREPKP